MQKRRISRYVRMLFIDPCDADNKEDVDGETDGVSASKIKLREFLSGYKKVWFRGRWLSVVHSPSACKGRGSLDAQIEFILAAKMKVHYYFNSINIFHFKSNSLLFISILNWTKSIIKHQYNFEIIFHFNYSSKLYHYV